jgi:hypothetical protein
MLFVGVDAHKAMSQITVMSEAGAILKRQRIPTSREGVQTALGRYQEPLRAVLEASYCWDPMHDWLKEVAEGVVLVHPMTVRAIAEARIKTDTRENDECMKIAYNDLRTTAALVSF